MSEENVAIVRRIHDAARRRDATTVLALYDPEVEWDISRAGIGGLTQRGVFRGHEGIRSVYRDIHETVDGYEEILDELIDADPEVISVATIRTRGRLSGAETDFLLAGVWRIEQGKVVHVLFFPTRQEALEAAGLSE